MCRLMVNLPDEYTSELSSTFNMWVDGTSQGNLKSIMKALNSHRQLLSE